MAMLLPALEWIGTPLAAIPYYWHLPVLIVVISLVYSATRFDEWGAILHEALRWGLRLTGFLVAIVVVLYVVATYM
jgi:hypothetical protein